MKRPYAAYAAPAAATGAPVVAASPSPAPATPYANYGYGQPAVKGQPQQQAQPAAAGGVGTLTKEQQQAQWHAQWQQYYAQQAAAQAQGTAAVAPPTNAGPMQPPQQQQYYQQPAAAPQAQQAQPQQPYYAQFPQQPAPAAVAAQPQQQYYQPVAQPQQQPYVQQQSQAAFAGPQPSAYGGAAQQNQRSGGAAPFYQGQPQQQAGGPPNKRPRFQNNQQGFQQPVQQPQQQQNWQQPQQQQFVPQSPQPQPQMGFQQPQQQQGPYGWPAGGAQQNGPQRASSGPMRGGAPGFAGPPPQSPQAGNYNNGGFRTPSGPASVGRGGGMVSPARGGAPFVAGSPGPVGVAGGNARFNGPVGVNAMPPGVNGGRPPVVARGARGGMHGGQFVAARGGMPMQGVGRGGATFNARGGRGGGVVNSRGGYAGGSSQSTAFEQSKIPAAIAVKPSTPADQPVPVNAKRTFTDFKIKSIEIPGIDWTWSVFDNLESDDDEEQEASDEAEGDEATTEEAKKQLPTGPRSNAPAKESAPASSSKNRADGHRMRINFAAVTLAPPAGAPTGPKGKGVKVEETKPAAATADADAEVAKETPAEPADAEDKPVEFGAPSKNMPPAPAPPTWSAFSKGPPQMSNNRVSIHYANNRRRFTIDADVIRAMRVFRAEGRVEITIDVTTGAGVRRAAGRKGKEWLVVKGVMLETRCGEQDSYAVIGRRQIEHAWANQTVGEVHKEEEKKSEEEEEDASPAAAAAVNGAADTSAAVEEADEDAAIAEKLAIAEKVDVEVVPVEDDTPEVVPGPYSELPPLYRVLSSHEGPEETEQYTAKGARELVINVYLDKLSGAPEEKWLKTGDVEEWLSALPAFGTRLAQQPWTGKIEVVDPDPPPTMKDVCEDWAGKSLLGVAKDRRRFVAEQISDAEGYRQLFARLVRDDKSFGKLNPRDVAPPLLEAAQSSRHTFNHTHLELAVLTLISLAQKYAGATDASQEFDEHIGQILMSVPQLLIFKALDGLFKIFLHEQQEAQRAAEKAEKKAAAEKRAQAIKEATEKAEKKASKEKEKKAKKLAKEESKKAAAAAASATAATTTPATATAATETTEATMSDMAVQADLEDDDDAAAAAAATATEVEAEAQYRVEYADAAEYAAAATETVDIAVGDDEAMEQVEAEAAVQPSGGTMSDAIDLDGTEDEEEVDAEMATPEEEAAAASE